MTTPVFCCGFECGLNGSAGQHWGSFSGSISFSTSQVRTGVRSLRVNNSSNTSTVRAVPAANAILVARAYVYFTSLPNVDVPILQGTDVREGAVFKASDSKIYAGRVI